jgi:hypothetical protein
VILFQGVKYAGILSYFLVRKRFEKIKFVYCGLKDGLFSKGI